jgi:hypothetical protein
MNLLVEPGRPQDPLRALLLQLFCRDLSPSSLQCRPRLGGMGNGEVHPFTKLRARLGGQSPGIRPALFKNL